jgi:hypothetical protein
MRERRRVSAGEGADRAGSQWYLLVQMVLLLPSTRTIYLHNILAFVSSNVMYVCVSFLSVNDVAQG